MDAQPPSTNAQPTLWSRILGQAVFVASGLYFASFARDGLPTAPALPRADWILPLVLLGLCYLVAAYGVFGIVRCVVSEIRR